MKPFNIFFFFNLCVDRITVINHIKLLTITIFWAVYYYTAKSKKLFKIAIYLKKDQRKHLYIIVNCGDPVFKVFAAYFIYIYLEHALEYVKYQRQEKLFKRVNLSLGLHECYLRFQKCNIYI